MHPLKKSTVDNDFYPSFPRTNNPTGSSGNSRNFSNSSIPSVRYVFYARLLDNRSSIDAFSADVRARTHTNAPWQSNTVDDKSISRLSTRRNHEPPPPREPLERQRINGKVWISICRPAGGLFNFICSKWPGFILPRCYGLSMHVPSPVFIALDLDYSRVASVWILFNPSRNFIALRNFFSKRSYIFF